MLLPDGVHERKINDFYEEIRLNASRNKSCYLLYTLTFLIIMDFKKQ